MDESYTHSKGTAIIYRKEWKRYLQKQFKLNGRVTGLMFKRDDETLAIICIYLPTLNTANKAEFKKIKRYVTKILTELPDDTKIIIGGDWNAVTNKKLDRTDRTSE